MDSPHIVFTVWVPHVYNIDYSVAVVYKNFLVGLDNICISGVKILRK